MGRKKPLPFSGQLELKTVEKYFDKFFVIKRISTKNESFENVSPFLVQKTIISNVGEVSSIRKLRSGDLLVEVTSKLQSEKLAKLKHFGTFPVTVTPHISLNSSKGVISCGELLNETVEDIMKELNSQGVTHVRRIFIRRNGQLLGTKHLILTFRSPKIPDSIKAGYINLTVKPYFPNPLRCFQCQRFGHSKISCRGTLTCARCAEKGHDSSKCLAMEKCVNCSEPHSSFSRSCSSWQFEKEVIAEKVTKNISYAEAKRQVKARLPSPATSYAKVVQSKPQAQCTQILPAIVPSIIFKASYTPSETCPKHAERFISSLPDISENRKRQKKDSKPILDKVSKSCFKTSEHQSIVSHNQFVLNPVTSKTSVSSELLPMAIFHPLEKQFNQSRESDADAEMTSSSDGDALEYNMSEDLEDSPSDIDPSTSSKPEKSNKYKNR